MTKEKGAATQKLHAHLDLRAMATHPHPKLVEPLASFDCRLIQLDEINEEAPTAYRNAVTNVFSAVDTRMGASIVYVLEGGPAGVALYFGVAGDQGSDLYEAMRNLRGTLEGQLPGISFGSDKKQPEVLKRFAKMKHHGAVFGVPTPQKEEPAAEEAHSQGIERLARNLLSSGRGDGTANQSHWQIVLVAEPLQDDDIRERLEQIQELQSMLAMYARTSIQASSNQSDQRSASTGKSKTEGRNDSESQSAGKSESATQGKNWGQNRSSGSGSSSSGSNSGESESKTVGTNTGYSRTTGSSLSTSDTENFSLAKTEGTSYGITQELANKSAQRLHDRIDEEVIPRFEEGLTKGLFRCALYIAAKEKSTYMRLQNAIRATYQGNESTLSPLRVLDLPENWTWQAPGLLRIEPGPDPASMLLHSLDACATDMRCGNLWSASELALVAGLPHRELPGIRRRKVAAFAIDLPDLASEKSIALGPVIDLGRRYPMHPAKLSLADLNKHIFITGVTGAGKTTTCLKILTESKLPFLVIEPAKTEYRALASQFEEGIDFYRPNGDPQQSLRINPFALVRRGQRIRSHAGFLKNVFATIFPLEASMPQIVEAAILAAYEEKGWDKSTDEWLGEGDPFDPGTRAWPTISDMIRQLDRIIPTYKLGREFEEKYRGSLVSRLRGLTEGTLGEILDVPQSIDWQALLQRNAVIELEELQSGEEKALLMALILGAINEAIRDLHLKKPGFRHIALVEEAHRLLARPDPGDSARAMAVEAFADMLAEVRKYGECLIIADQIPAKLIPDVIKNTHTKIVHRLFAEDDRRTMAEAMMMNESQRDFLPNLAAGEAVVFCGGWHGPVHVAIDCQLRTDGPPLQEELLARCYTRQLWRERERYYPELCLVVRDWTENDAEALRFTRFLLNARRAWLNILRLIPVSSQSLGFSPSPAAANRAFHALRTQLQQCEAEFDNHDTFIDAFCAVLLDANPRPRAESTHPPAIIVDRTDKNERELLKIALKKFLELVDRCENTSALSAQIRAESIKPAADARALVNQLINPLQHYQSI